MSLIIRVGKQRAQWWQAHLQSLLPEIRCRLWDESGNDEDIRYAVVWKPPSGGLRRFRNLEVIVSIGAGVDHILADPELPKDIPIIRTTSQDLTAHMREYVSLHVLRLHRRLPEIEAAQAAQEWRQLVGPPAHRRRIGIMGMGNLGADCAKALAFIGFDVAGWSRTPKAIDYVTNFSGDASLEMFLARTDILVCLLPLTEATQNILSASLFGKLAKGASIINAARGGHLNEQDLLKALDSRQITNATLDVFKTEPLPPGHPFWNHPNVLITPHVASLIDPVAGGEVIAANIRRFQAGQPIANLVDLEQGY